METCTAVTRLIEALRDDPEYAWSWHCNIAMAFVDEGGEPIRANHAAARFLKNFANVKPTHPLPALVDIDWRSRALQAERALEDFVELARDLDTPEHIVVAATLFNLELHVKELLKNRSPH